MGKCSSNLSEIIWKIDFSMTKVSLITTVKNEQATIKDFLDSILQQTRIPDEIIIVDGGSSDSTTDIIKGYTDRLPIISLSSPGSNIAKGRNEAIKKSKYNFIACTDGGCKLTVNWLQNIIEPFEQLSADVVCGFYVPWIQSDFEEIASYLIFPKIEKLKPNSFMPSSRSVAFLKSAWKDVGGYPEWLDTAEDTLFDLNLKKAGKNFAIAKDAVVLWRIRESNRKIFKQYYNYAKGDGKALLFVKRYLPRYFAVVLCVMSAVVLWQNIWFWVLAIPAFFGGLWLKYVRKVKKLSPKRFFTASLVVFAIESGLLLGYIRGISTRLKNRKY